MVCKVKALAAACVALITIGLSGCDQVPSRAAKADDWRADIKQVRMGVAGGEEGSVVLGTWKQYQIFLESATELPTKLYRASDYNGVIQAMVSGQVDISQLGPAAYASLDEQVGPKAAPILIQRSNEGATGYYSGILVRADSPYRKIDDLKGKTIGYVDFNSTSGYLYPRWKLRDQGIDPDTFFSNSAITGGHTQGVLALANRQFDAVAFVASGGTPERGFTSGAYYELARRGLIKIEDFRIIWTAGPIPNALIAVRTDTPQPFQDIVRGALAAMPYDNPQAMADAGVNLGSTLVATDRKAYLEIIAIRGQEIAQRRANRSTGEKAK
jgi:phosphonate transport system substrate-binding protein